MKKEIDDLIYQISCLKRKPISGTYYLSDAWSNQTIDDVICVIQSWANELEHYKEAMK